MWRFPLDAADFYNSEFFDNSSSGIGGWGDPSNDYQITTGGFKDVVVAYPTPHHLRRHYTLYPYDDLGFTAPFPLPKGLMINTTMTKKNVDYIVDNYEGDYFGFQTYFESTIVSLVLHNSLGFSVWASDTQFQGPHPGAHLIMGG